jgi:tungstate transport system substrate-binding protein
MAASRAGARLLSATERAGATVLRYANAIALALAIDAAPCVGAEPAPAPQSIILATTTSTADSGLLDVLVPEFRRQTGIEVKVIAVGSGAALRMAESGDCDAVLAHSPDAERKLVDAGHLTSGRRVMHNDFVILGPRDDPANVKHAPDLNAAMQAIARGGKFVSRGDDSGTHKMEMSLWQAAGIDPASVQREETGQGMAATLYVADQRSAYTLSDRGTFLAARDRIALEVVFEDDPRLTNVYHAYVVDPAKHPRVKVAGAEAFVRFLTSPATQRQIGDYRRSEFGRSLFVPDAGAEDLPRPTARPK